jgi:DeoR/GlpR family transcriptional regulator of sugar metabolism
VLSAQRRMVIANELQQTGLATVHDLARRLNVSEVTIRRDLGLLEQTGGAVRIHGGAMLRRYQTAFEPLWDTKVTLRNESKERIGQAAAARVRPGETILLDSGTTTLCVAKALKVPCAVVTVDLKIALELASRPASDAIQALMVGGEARRGLFSTTGHFALEMLNQIHVDRAFLGADAIDIDAGITNATVQGTGIKKAIIASANEVVLVADASKLGSVALSKVAALSEVDLWITDQGPDPEAFERVRRTGLKIEVV